MSLSPRSKMRSMTREQKMALAGRAIEQVHQRHIGKSIDLSLERNEMSLTEQARFNAILILTPGLFKAYHIKETTNTAENKKQFDKMMEKFENSAEVTENEDGAQEIIADAEELKRVGVKSKNVFGIRDRIIDFYVDNYIFALGENRRKLYPQRMEPIDDEEILELTGMYAMGFTYTE